MSTDSRGTAARARGLASRLRAAAAEHTRRSQALIKSRLESDAPGAVAVAPASAAALPTDLPDDQARFADAAADAAPGGGASQAEEPAVLATPSMTAASRAARPSPEPGGATAYRPAGDDDDGRLGPAILRAADQHVPAPLRTVAAWAWRLLLIAAVVYLSFKVAVALRLVVLPFIAATLLCALLQPLVGRLCRAGLPRLAATGVTLLATIGVLAGVGILITNQIQAGYPQLSAEVRTTVNTVRRFLERPPFRLNNKDFNQLSNKLLDYLAQHKTVVAGTVLTGGKYFLEVLTGLILTIFITFFLLKDGDMLWSRLVRGFTRFRGAGQDAMERADRASGAAWHALVRYIHGTTIIALIHAVIIAIALWLLGVPLVLPIAILVFIAAYVPLVGILVVGAVAILITLATQGWIAAVILLAVFLVENQLESHLLQPLVIGRAVRLHPLEVIIVLAVGGIVAGVPGAIVAVPTAAVVSAAWRSNQEPRRPRDPVERRRARQGAQE